MARDPLVRPYMLTGGRIRSEGADVAVDTTLRTTGSGRSLVGERRLEEAELLRACVEPRSFPEVVDAMGLPLGVVRVLAGDLVAAGHLTTVAVDDGADSDLLERLLAGLKEHL